MTISFAQQCEVARILGFPNLTPMSSLQPHYPFFSSPFAQWQPYAFLMQRLAAAAPEDEVQMFGAESTLFGSFFTPALITLTIGTPSSIAAGVTVRLNLGGNQYTYLTEQGDTPTIVAEAFAALIAEDPVGSAQFMPNPSGGSLTLYNVAAIGTDANGVQCFAASSDPSCTVAFGGSPSNFSAGATSGGTEPPGPQFTPIKTTAAIFGYVPIIHILEGDLLNARANLDTLQAAEWQPRQDELDVRYQLYNHYRIELANRLSVPLDPDIPGNLQRLAQRLV